MACHGLYAQSARVIWAEQTRSQRPMVVLHLPAGSLISLSLFLYICLSLSLYLYLLFLSLSLYIYMLMAM